jgi:hypothetical protein
LIFVCNIIWETLAVANYAVCSQFYELVIVS